MNSRKKLTVPFVAAILGGAIWLNAPTTSAEEIAQSATPARSKIDHGRYLVRLGGCNDCHTPGFQQLGEKVPETAWLTGVPVGYRGPWGTTYASNLRLFIKPFSEDDFVKLCRARNDRPPMPWLSLHAMTDEDLRSIYAYIRSLGEAGETVPSFLPPDREPTTPYVNLMPVMPAGKAPATQPTAVSAAKE